MKIAGPKEANTRGPAAARQWLLWIDGKQAPSRSGKMASILNPATGEILAEAAQGDGADADLAVACAQRAFRGPWSKLTARERAKMLFGFSALVREHLEALALLETQNTGKPIRDSRGEAMAVADCLEYYAGAATKHFGETIPVGKKGLEVTLREPIGVCALIVPWNYPMVIATWKLAPALACGNTVVLKPASYTPLSVLFLAELAARAGIPQGVINVVSGAGGVVGGRLATHPGVAKISFTGSTEVGAQISRAAAEGIKRVSLELGGKSPNIVFADTDLDRCVEGSASSVFSNTGQDCCSRSRAIVERKICEEFTERLVERTKKYAIGDPTLEQTDIGPMISQAQRQRILEYIQIGQKEGAKLRCGGVVPGWSLAAGAFLTPAIFSATDCRMRIVKEEIFGPVLCVQPFDTEEEAIALANATEYGLSGSIWTRDVGRALRVARGVESGVLSVNSTTSVHLEAPFGGYKKSGIGRELGMKAMDLYSEVKSVFISEE